MSNLTAKRFGGAASTPVIGIVPLCCIWPMPCAQITESTLARTMRPGIRLEREFGVVARCDLVQLVLVEERDDLAVGLDERHHRIERHAGDERAGPQRQVDDVAVAGREDGRLLEFPLGVGEVGLDLRDRGDVAAHRRGQLRPDLRLVGDGRAELRLEVAEVGLGLLEVEAVAGTGGRELTVLLHARLRELDPRADRGRVAACADRNCSRNCSPPPFAPTSWAFRLFTVSWYGVGSTRNSTSPFFTSRLPSSTGTSITRPRTCETIGTVYLKTRTSADDGATTFSNRISAVSATIGMIATVTWLTVFHGSHLNLMKISQTKKL